MQYIYSVNPHELKKFGIKIGVSQRRKTKEEKEKEKEKEKEN